MKFLLRTIVGLSIAAAVMLPAATIVAAASLSVSPNTGVAGSTATVSGAAFGANNAVNTFFNGSGGTQVGTEFVDGSGNLPSETIAIPNVSPGSYQVFATDGTNTATTTFTVVSNNTGGANLTINSSSGTAGSQVTLNGSGFNANETVNLGVDGNNFTSVRSDGNGNFVTTVTLPGSLGVGNHTVSSTGVNSGHSASVVFDVTSGGGEGREPGACRPGNGFGDRNHCHTGARGDNHGHGNNGDGDDQGDD
jgi:hypothetical protein